ncbi:Fe-S oxidoreductase [hydrothermal vent metagenome]|uniref:Fe-S oxidoreductase n=1 Tax=hydrothermal vent metagenome TaxID=652676 RepID=A0A3B1C9X4_9ZZZZ
MLTLAEKIIFIVLVIVSLIISYKTFSRMFKIINRGKDPIPWKETLKNFPKGLKIFLTQQTLFTTRPVIGFIHALVAWGFTIYVLVNSFDVIAAYVPGFAFFPNSVIGFIYRLFVDIFSVLVFLGVFYFLIRRFIFNEEKLIIKPPVHVTDDVKKGVRRDSLIVGLFIMIHVGARFVGASFAVAHNGGDAAQPLAAIFSSLWQGLSPEQLVLGEHISWWIALGAILAFVPYFPLSKHAHLFMAPFNYMVPDDRPNKGTIKPLNFEDESIEQFGVGNMEHLPQKSLLDAYSCIMCNRCQDNCPAYQTGKELSPSAIEINKRYYFNSHGQEFIDGAEVPLKGLLLTDNALWACTSCNFCVYACPVGNEPLVDILHMRQDKVMMESDFPSELITTFKNLETNFNPWAFNSQDRKNWAEGLDIKTMNEDPNGEILFWVGCAGSFDQRYQKVSQAFAKIMQKAGINFRILGNEEKCNGDTARRLGNEYLAQTLMMENIEMLNKYGVKEIVTACPHCFNSLKNEYPKLGGEFKILHHSEFIDKLIQENKISLKNDENSHKITYHDSCYLGRYNSIYDQPRASIKAIDGLELVEMDRSLNNGFCCGAGGGRMFMEETEGERINEVRTKEAIETGADTIASACPFCMTMLSDGVKTLEKNEEVEVKDIAEIILEHIQ